MTMNNVEMQSYFPAEHSRTPLRAFVPEIGGASTWLCLCEMWGVSANNKSQGLQNSASGPAQDQQVQPGRVIAKTNQNWWKFPGHKQKTDESCALQNVGPERLLALSSLGSPDHQVSAMESGNNMESLWWACAERGWAEKLAW